MQMMTQRALLGHLDLALAANTDGQLPNAIVTRPSYSMKPSATQRDAMQRDAISKIHFWKKHFQKCTFHLPVLFNEAQCSSTRCNAMPLQEREMLCNCGKEKCNEEEEKEK